MSQVTKCDICGSLDDFKSLEDCKHFRITVQRRTWIFGAESYEHVDVCNKCIKTLREAARKEQ